MVVIETQEQLEMFGWDIANNMPYIPENLRLLIIIEPEAFGNLVKQIVPPWARPEDEGYRFIYNSQSGVEFGVKKASHEPV
jgi:hypothetical protein